MSAWRTFRNVIILLRPWQWVKNLFVFLPMFFGGELLDSACWCGSLLAFFVLCFITSAIYCFNDVVDVEYDRCHPIKKARPIASGELSVAAGCVIGILIGMVGLFIFVCGIGVGIIECVILGVYVLLNVSYSLGLKNVVILDMLSVSLGFVLRVFLGGIVCDIWVSPWIVCMVFILTLFLILSKRRSDVLIYIQTGAVTRKVVKEYDLAFVNQMIGITGTITVVCYIIYSLQPEVIARLHSEYVYITSIFVLTGIMRYMQLIRKLKQTYDPVIILLKDRFIQITILLWIVAFSMIIYGGILIS